MIQSYEQKPLSRFHEVSSQRIWWCYTNRIIIGCVPSRAWRKKVWQRNANDASANGTVMLAHWHRISSWQDLQEIYTRTGRVEVLKKGQKSSFFGLLRCPEIFWSSCLAARAMYTAPPPSFQPGSEDGRICGGELVETKTSGYILCPILWRRMKVRWRTFSTSLLKHPSWNCLKWQQIRMRPYHVMSYLKTSEYIMICHDISWSLFSCHIIYASYVICHTSCCIYHK